MLDLCLRRKRAKNGRWSSVVACLMDEERYTRAANLFSGRMAFRRVREFS